MLISLGTARSHFGMAEPGYAPTNCALRALAPFNRGGTTNQEVNETKLTPSAPTVNTAGE